MAQSWLEGQVLAEGWLASLISRFCDYGEMKPENNPNRDLDSLVHVCTLS